MKLLKQMSEQVMGGRDESAHPFDEQMDMGLSLEGNTLNKGNIPFQNLVI